MKTRPFAFLIIPLSLALISILVWGTMENAPAADAGTGIEGVISIGPTHGGAIRQDEPPTNPMPNKDFVAENDQHAPVASFKTDEQGRFHISLAPGKYSISLKEKTRFPRCGPFTVEVVAGKMTKVNWECDSGLR
jgi:hypothetical protein